MKKNKNIRIKNCLGKYKKTHKTWYPFIFVFIPFMIFFLYVDSFIFDIFKTGFSWENVFTTKALISTIGIIIIILYFKKTYNRAICIIIEEKLFKLYYKDGKIITILFEDIQYIKRPRNIDAQLVICIGDDPRYRFLALYDFEKNARAKLFKELKEQGIKFTHF